MDSVLTPKQVCAMLRISERTLMRMVKKGTGPKCEKIPIRYNYLFHEKDLDDWIVSRTVMAKRA